MIAEVRGKPTICSGLRDHRAKEGVESMMNTGRGRPRKVIRMGTSEGITLPRAWRDVNNVTLGDRVYVEDVGDLLIVRPLPPEEPEPVTDVRTKGPGEKPGPSVCKGTPWPRSG